MPLKNIFFPNENFLFNIFYGAINDYDIRDHTMELLTQTVLTKNYAKITVGINIRGVDISPSNISSTVSFKSTPHIIRSRGGIIISPSQQIDVIAQKFIDASKKHGEHIEIRRTLTEALHYFELDMLFDQCNTIIEKYSGF